MLALLAFNEKYPLYRSCTCATLWYRTNCTQTISESKTTYNHQVRMPTQAHQSDYPFPSRPSPRICEHEYRDISSANNLVKPCKQLSPYIARISTHACGVQNMNFTIASNDMIDSEAYTAKYLVIAALESTMSYLFPVANFWGRNLRINVSTSNKYKERPRFMAWACP